MAVPVVGPNSPIRQLIARPAVRVSSEATLAEASAAMRRANVSAVLVGINRSIATERDLARGMAAGLGSEALVVDVATPHPVIVGGQTTVIEAAAVMLNEEVRHLVVTVGEHDEGIISMRDVMAVLLQVSSPHIWLGTLRFAIGVARPST